MTGRRERRRCHGPDATAR